MDKTSVFYTRKRMPPSLSSLGSFSTSSAYFEPCLLPYCIVVEGESVSSLLHLSFWYSRGSPLPPPEKPNNHGSSATYLKDTKAKRACWRAGQEVWYWGSERNQTTAQWSVNPVRLCASLWKVVIMQDESPVSANCCQVYLSQGVPARCVAKSS